MQTYLLKSWLWSMPKYLILKNAIKYRLGFNFPAPVIYLSVRANLIGQNHSKQDEWKSGTGDTWLLQQLRYRYLTNTNWSLGFKLVSTVSEKMSWIFRGKIYRKCQFSVLFTSQKILVNLEHYTIHAFCLHIFAYGNGHYELIQSIC